MIHIKKFFLQAKEGSIKHPIITTGYDVFKGDYEIIEVTDNYVVIEYDDFKHGVAESYVIPYSAITSLEFVTSIS